METNLVQVNMAMAKTIVGQMLPDVTTSKRPLLPGRLFGIIHTSGVEDMCMLDTIHAKRDEIYAIAKQHKAEKLWVFGSVARKEERPDSDVDFLVQFDNTATLLDHGRLYNKLNALFGRGVDVVDLGGVRPGSIFSQMIEKDLVAV